MLLCLSLAARHAPLEVREPFALQPDELPELGAYLRPHVEETLVISTCQRFEAYVVPWRAMLGDCLAGLFAQLRGVAPDQLAIHARLLNDQQAAEHLFRVAAGLESQVLGEAEILGQVRRGLEASRAAGLLGPRLGGLAQQAIGAGRRVRDETALGRGALSVPRVAVDRARSAMGDLDGRTVLLVGAGETAQLAARSLGSVGRLLVVNRTLAHAEELAAEVGGEAWPWTDLERAVIAADLVICCVGAERPPLSRSLVVRCRHRRPERPLFLVDLAVPRGIEPDVVRLNGVSLFDLDDLNSEAAAHHAERERAVPQAESIVATELARAWRSWGAHRAQPAIVALRERAEAIRRGELAHARVLSGLAPEQEQAIEYVTRAIVNKLLHQPTVWLKTNPSQAETALHDVFGIGAGR